MREPAKTPKAAQSRYRRFLQRSLSTVHGNAQWYTTASGSIYALLIRPQAALLRRENAPTLYLGASQLYDIAPHPKFEGEFKARTHGYVYSVTSDAEQQQEVFGWHWHPRTRPDPHVHLQSEHAAFRPVGKLHVPTARVSLEAILRFLIDDLGVTPARPDWRDVLDEIEQRFLRFRSWHHSSEAPEDDD